MFRKNKQQFTKIITGKYAEWDMNRWFAENRVKVVNTVQSGHGDTLTITIIYTRD